MTLLAIVDRLPAFVGLFAAPSTLTLVGTLWPACRRAWKGYSRFLSLCLDKRELRKAKRAAAET